MNAVGDYHAKAAMGRSSPGRRVRMHVVDFPVEPSPRQATPRELKFRTQDGWADDKLRSSGRAPPTVNLVVLTRRRRRRCRRRVRRLTRRRVERSRIKPPQLSVFRFLQTPSTGLQHPAGRQAPLGRLCRCGVFQS